MATYRIPNNYALICPQTSERADTPPLYCFIVNEERLRLGMTLPLHSLILDILQLLEFNLSPSGLNFAQYLVGLIVIYWVFGILSI